MDGMEGILASYKGSRRVVISVTLLRRSMALEIDRSRIMPVGARGMAAAGTAEELSEFEAISI